MSSSDDGKIGPDTSDYGATASGSNVRDVEDGAGVDERHGKLHRGLSARQVQMIAVAGTIGTGLFLGTGKSLAR